MTKSRPTNTDDIIDSRDVIEAIDTLQDDLTVAFCDAIQDDDADADDPRFVLWLDEQIQNETDHAEDARDYRVLVALAKEGADYAADWEYGETLIRDDYFKTYAQELAEDIGAIDRTAGWPARCIDWDQAAAELRTDYTGIDFDGITYWIR